MTDPANLLGAAELQKLRLTANVISTLDGLEELAGPWEQLWRGDFTATPFQSPQWLIPWWRQLGEGELCTVSLSDSRGALQAVLPLYIYTDPVTRERQLLLLGAGTSDYLGGIFPDQTGSTSSPRPNEPAGPRSPVRIVRAALSFLELHRSSWDRATLHQLRQTSPLLAFARSADYATTRSEDCAALPVTTPAYLPAKLRANIGRYRRRAETRGTIEFTVATSADQALGLLDGLIQLHTRRWDAGGVLAPLAVQKHHRETVPALFHAGVLRMFALSLEGNIIATLYAFVDPLRHLSHAAPARSLYCYLIGFDPDLADLSPGTLLLASALEHCRSEGIASMDMLRGGETYKHLWGAHVEETFSFELK